MKKQNIKLPEDAKIIKKARPKLEKFAYTFVFGLTVGIILTRPGWDSAERTGTFVIFFLIGAFSYYFFTTSNIPLIYRIIIILGVDVVIFLGLTFAGIMLGIFSLY